MHPTVAIVIIAVCAFISSVFSILRIFVRRFIIGKMEIDDWIFAVNWLLFLPNSALGIMNVYYGNIVNNNLMHQIIDFPRLHAWLKIVYVQITFYYVCSYLIKISLLCLYLRLCRTGSQFRYTNSGKMLHRLSWASIVFVTLIFIPSVVGNIAGCSPISTAWHPEYLNENSDASCIDRKVLVIAISCLHAVADIIIAVLPIPLVLKIRGSVPYRIGLVALLMLGLIATGLGFGRVAILTFTDSRVGLEYSRAVEVLIFSYAEISIAIAAAAAPSVRPIFRRAIGKIKGHNSSGTRETDYSEATQQSAQRAKANERMIQNLQVVDAFPENSNQGSGSTSRGNSTAKDYENVKFGMFHTAP